jgi:phage baseplate assembly protein W
MITLRIPLQVNAQGGFSTVTDLATIIEQRITDILVTNFGDRVMRPTHGADLGGFLFSPIMEDLMAVKAQEVRDVLNRTLGVGTIRSVDVEQVMGTDSSVRVAVTYQAEPGTAPRTTYNTISGLVTEETVFNDALG